MRAFLDATSRHFREADNVRPLMKLLQRRYERQNAQPFLDAVFNVDLRTTVKVEGQRKSRKQPKFQPEWIELAYRVIQGKASNLQFQVGCEFDYDRCRSIREPGAEMLFLNAWMASREFFKSMHVKL